MKNFMNSIAIKEITKAKAADDVLCVAYFISCNQGTKKKSPLFFRWENWVNEKVIFQEQSGSVQSCLCSSPHSTASVNKRKKEIPFHSVKCHQGQAWIY